MKIKSHIFFKQVFLVDKYPEFYGLPMFAQSKDIADLANKPSSWMAGQLNGKMPLTVKNEKVVIGVLEERLLYFPKLLQRIKQKWEDEVEHAPIEDKTAPWRAAREVLERYFNAAEVEILASDPKARRLMASYSIAYQMLAISDTAPQGDLDVSPQMQKAMMDLTGKRGKLGSLQISSDHIDNLIKDMDQPEVRVAVRVLHDLKSSDPSP